MVLKEKNPETAAAVDAPTAAEAPVITLTEALRKIPCPCRSEADHEALRLAHGLPEKLTVPVPAEYAAIEIDAEEVEA